MRKLAATFSEVQPAAAKAAGAKLQWWLKNLNPRAAAIQDGESDDQPPISGCWFEGRLMAMSEKQEYHWDTMVFL